MAKNAFLPLHQLIGDYGECLYQLGLKDRAHIAPGLNHLTQLLATPSPPITKALHAVIKKIIHLWARQSAKYYQLVGHYAQGTDRPIEEILFSLFLPECMSFMHRLSLPAFGCSSIFYKGKGDLVFHARVLDFPLQGSYDLHERLLLRKVPAGPHWISLSTAGMPFGVITAMNSHGLTLALHQKFTDIFNYKGLPIFQLTQEIVDRAKTVQDVIDYLKKHQSLTAWNINCSDQAGNCASIDICGKELFYDSFQLLSGEFRIFNNSPLSPNLAATSFSPHGLKDYNKIRYDGTLEKMKRAQNLDLIEFNALCGLISKDFQHHLDCLTPSAQVCAVMCAQSKEISYIPGPSPKIFRGAVVKIEHPFEKIQQTIHRPLQETSDPHKSRGHFHYMQAQVALDFRDYPQAYHQCQMAISDYIGSPMSPIAQFFFLVVRYLNETHVYERKKILDQFFCVSAVLPPYLKEQAMLFINRIERILDLTQSFGPQDFDIIFCRELFKWEQLIPAPLFYKVTSALTYPRLDMLDIIYLYYQRKH